MFETTSQLSLKTTGQLSAETSGYLSFGITGHQSVQMIFMDSIDYKEDYGTWNQKAFLCLLKLCLSTCSPLCTPNEVGY